MIFTPNGYAFVFRKTPAIAELLADIRAHLREKAEANQQPVCAATWDEDAHLFANTCAETPEELQAVIEAHLDPMGLTRGQDYVVSLKDTGILDDNDWIQTSQVSGYIEYCGDDKGRGAAIGLSATFLYMRLNNKHANFPPLQDNPPQSLHPQDPWDFRRCQMMLARHPELEPRLPEMAGVSRQWAGIVNCWPALTASYADEVGDLYDEPSYAPRTQRLLDSAANQGLH